MRVVVSHENGAPRGLAWNQPHFYNMYSACWQTAGMRSIWRKEDGGHSCLLWCIQVQVLKSHSIFLRQILSKIWFLFFLTIPAALQFSSGEFHFGWKKSNLYFVPWILLLTWVGGGVSKQEEKPKIKGRRKVRNNAEMGPDEMKSGWSQRRRESCVRIINEWWGGKTEENQEENNHSEMKGAAWVSLWCTKQSQAERLALHLSVYLGKRKKNREVEEEERGRGREKCWRERASGACYKK